MSVRSLMSSSSISFRKLLQISSQSSASKSWFFIKFCAGQKLRTLRTDLPPVRSLDAVWYRKVFPFLGFHVVFKVRVHGSNIIVRRIGEDLLLHDIHDGLRLLCPKRRIDEIILHVDDDLCFFIGSTSFLMSGILTDTSGTA